MEIKNIGGGKDFSIVKFKEKLASAVKFGGLKEKRENIVKVVRNSQSAIRGGRFSAAAAMAKLKRSDDDLSFGESRDIKKVFEQLGSVPEPKEDSIHKAVAAAGMRHAAKIAELKKPHSGSVRINRASSDYKDIFINKLAEHGTGLSAGSVSVGSHHNVSGNRGETYERGLGGGSDGNKTAARRRVNF